MNYKVSTKQLTETVAPVVEPVTVAQMKTHLRVDGTDSDILLGLQITAARQWVEKDIQQALVQRTYRADILNFYSVITLPFPPLSSVTSVKYYNTDSPMVLTTLDSTAYRHDLGYGVIYYDGSVTIPSVAARHDAVQITFIAGYEPDGSPQDFAGNVPEAIKAAIKLQVANLFENRETSTPLKITQLKTVDRLLAAYREY